MIATSRYYYQILLLGGTPYHGLAATRWKAGRAEHDVWYGQGWVYATLFMSQELSTWEDVLFLLLRSIEKKKKKPPCFCPITIVVIKWIRLGEKNRLWANWLDMGAREAAKRSSNAKQKDRMIVATSEILVSSLPRSLPNPHPVCMMLYFYNPEAPPPLRGRYFSPSC
jgi:hypothetical protein